MGKNEQPNLSLKLVDCKINVSRKGLIKKP